jgi:lipopolysaccharide export system permease protein
MAFSEDQINLFLTLNDGVVLEVPNNEGGFQRAEFVEQFLPIRGISNALARGAGGDRRGDREMSTGQLADSAKAAELRRAQFLEDIRSENIYVVKRALGWQIDGDSLVPPLPAAEGIQTLPDEAFGPDPMAPDEMTRGVFLNTRTFGQQAEFLRLSAIEKRVEIHKKYSIAFACIVFVLIGAPLAVRFPRGGVGMVITASVLIFALFWACLIGGEALSDDGYVSPALAMWLPNLILLPIGIILVRRISTQVATARGGGWDDLIFTFVTGIRKPFRQLVGKRRG